MAGGKLGDAAIDRMGRRHIGKPQKSGERIAIKLEAPIGQHLEGLQFRGENKTPILPSVVERLDAETVAHQGKPPLLPVPQRKGEHADETLDRRLHAPFGDGLDQHLGVGMSLETPPARLELRPQLAGIVDFAIVGEHAGAAARHHRLGAGRRQIDDG